MIRRVALLASFVAVAAAVTVPSSQAASQSGPLTTTNNLTFRRTVALPGVTLPAGAYVFERDANPNSNIVRVMTPNYQKMLYVGFTMPVERPRRFREPVSFGEAPAGEAIPIIAWYPVGSSKGHQFLYR